MEKTKEILKTIDFNLLLESNITLKKFLKTVGISRYEYDNCSSLIKEINPNLYKQIKDKIHNTTNRITQDDSVVHIAKQIKDGIKDDDGNIRKFELLDYFLNTKLDYSDFIAKYINSDKNDKQILKAIKAFFIDNKIEDYKRYDNGNKINIEQELNGTIIFMKDNEPYEVTRKEKEEVINFLQERGIPLYIKVYKQALRRHISGKLILEDDKKMIKKG